MVTFATFLLHFERIKSEGGRDRYAHCTCDFMYSFYICYDRSRSNWKPDMKNWQFGRPTVVERSKSSNNLDRGWKIEGSNLAANSLFWSGRPWRTKKEDLETKTGVPADDHWRASALETDSILRSYEREQRLDTKDVEWTTIYDAWSIRKFDWNWNWRHLPSFVCINVWIIREI